MPKFIRGIHPRFAAIILDEVKRFNVGGPLPIVFEIDDFTGMLKAIMTTVERNRPTLKNRIEQQRDLVEWCSDRNPMDSIGISSSMLLEAGINADIADHIDKHARRRILEMLHSLAKEMYEHELAEWFTRDGVRVRDPHAADADAPP